MRDIPFRLEGQLATFEKADADADQERRIAGVVSTEVRDRQGEILLQDGLDFSPFLANGWFNDNHSKATDGIVGYPTGVLRFNKGDTLPNGTIASSKCTWAEGYLIKGHPRADAIWRLGQALEKSPRRSLGFSVEGSVQKRIGADKRIVAKAVIQNCAVTNAPVNTDTRMEILAKSLQHIEDGGHLDEQAAAYALSEAPEAQLATLIKSLFAGAQVCPAEAGDAAGGAALAKEDLEDDLKITAVPIEKKKKKPKAKLSKAEALLLLSTHLPAQPAKTLLGLIDYAGALGRREARENGK